MQGSESAQITARADAFHRRARTASADGHPLVSRATSLVDGGWRPAGARVLTRAQRVVIASQPGEPYLVNVHTRWMAFTVRRLCSTDVYAVSPDGQALRFVVSVAAVGVKTVDWASRTTP